MQLTRTFGYEEQMYSNRIGKKVKGKRCAVQREKGSLFLLHTRNVSEMMMKRLDQ